MHRVLTDGRTMANTADAKALCELLPVAVRRSNERAIGMMCEVARYDADTERERC
jgi:hypothetical protein